LSRHESTTDVYTLSLHDALPILKMTGFEEMVPGRDHLGRVGGVDTGVAAQQADVALTRDIRRVALRADQRTTVLAKLATAVRAGDRKSTRLNSSHVKISYAVFCL